MVSWMRPGLLGIVGGIIALVSIALPWWTMTQTVSPLGITMSYSTNIYPYRVSAPLHDFDVGERLWFGWVSLALILVGGALGIVGGIKQISSLLFAGGAFALISIGVFAVGLLLELPNMPFMVESPRALFYFGAYGFSPFQFSIYLSFGFWLALVSCTLMLAASMFRIRVVVTESAIAIDQ